MAANVIWIFAFLILVNHLGVYSQSTNTAIPQTTKTTTPVTTTTPGPTRVPTPVPINTDIGICTCDLTANACDVNCCCDEDCTADDRSAFSECIEIRVDTDSQTCIQSSVILIANTPYRIDETVPGLFCIITDNYKARNYYTVPTTIDTEEKYKEYKDKYGKYSYESTPIARTISAKFYRSGEPIYTLYESKALGVLGLPRASLSQDCMDTNPAAFLYDQSYQCVRRMPSLREECATNLALKGATYYKGFKVITTPAVFDIFPPDNTTSNDSMTTTASSVTVTASTVAPVPPVPDPGLYNTSYVVPIEIIQPINCIDKRGLNISCNFTDAPDPFLQYDTDLQKWFCHYLVYEAEYVVSHNSTGGITAVGLRLTLAILSDDALPLTNKYTAIFKKEGETDTFQRSGNPGYVVGEPVMAGKLVQRTTTDTQVQEAIELSTDRDNWLTIITSAATGECWTDPNNRVSVKFGEDMRSGCTIRVFYSNMSEVCGLIQAAAVQALVGNVDIDKLYVATFGSAAVEKVGDWVKVMVENTPPGPPSSTTPGLCRNIVLGMHIEIMYSSVGALGNPQPKILGVMFRYEALQDIYFQCVGPYCQPDAQSLTQPIEIVSSVGFVDASQAAIGVTAEKPKFTAKLPEDFFYPFMSSHAVVCGPSAVLAMLIPGLNLILLLALH